MNTYDRMRFTLVIATLAVVVFGAVAAAYPTQSSTFSCIVPGSTTVDVDGPTQDHSASTTTRAVGGCPEHVGVKNVYQEFIFFVWHNVHTAEDLASSTPDTAQAEQLSPAPSAQRNGRFVGDHFYDGEHKGSTTVDPPLDNCPTANPACLPPTE